MAHRPRQAFTAFSHVTPVKLSRFLAAHSRVQGPDAFEEVPVLREPAVVGMRQGFCRPRPQCEGEKRLATSMFDVGCTKSAVVCRFPADALHIPLRWYGRWPQPKKESVVFADRYEISLSDP